jgi:hypothetical protein
MADALVKHAFQSPYLDGPDATKLQPSAWNAALLFSAGVDGQVLTRSAAAATGAAWSPVPAPDLSGLVVTTRTVNGHALSADVTVSKADVGLSAVENTALSTWAGSANLVTLGGSVTTASSALTLNKNDVKIGDGRAFGAPVGTIVATDTGIAGNVTGTVKYAYTETGGSGGETTIGPITTITVTSKQVQLVLPSIRRGASNRTLYRTKAGGAIFFLLFQHDGGHGPSQTTYVDNTLDSALTVVAPSVDTTTFLNAWIHDGVKLLSTHPDQASNPADLTLLTAQPDGTTGYAIDAYSQIVARTTGAGQSFISFGQNCGAHFIGYAINPTFGDNSATTVFKVGGQGHVALAPLTLHDPALSDGKSFALTVGATFGTGNTVNATAVSFTTTGAGSAAFDQTAMLTALVAGYTGTAKTYALRSSNATAAGTALGLYAAATGAAVGCVGVWGHANFNASTQAFGGFFSDGTDPATLSAPGGGVTAAALAATNGSGTQDIFVGYDNATPVVRVKNGGDVDITNLGATATLTLKATSGGGVLVARVNGGSSSDLGTTNNISVRILTNNVVASTFSTSGQLTVVGGFGCNTKAAQGSVASGGALAAYVTGAFGLDSTANMQALYNQVVAIRSALVANGIMS